MRTQQTIQTSQHYADRIKVECYTGNRIPDNATLFILLSDAVLDLGGVEVYEEVNRFLCRDVAPPMH